MSRLHALKAAGKELLKQILIFAGAIAFCALCDWLLGSSWWAVAIVGGLCTWLRYQQARQEVP